MYQNLGLYGVWILYFIFQYILFFPGFPLWNFQFPTYYAGSNMENNQKNKTKTILQQYIEPILEAHHRTLG